MRQEAWVSPSYEAELTTKGVMLMTLLTAAICLLAVFQQPNFRLAEFELADELARVKLETELDDGAIRKIREAVADTVRSSAKQRAAAGRTRSNGLVDLEVAEAIAREIKEDSGAMARSYFNGWQERRKFFKETAISQAIVVLDQRLLLDTKQAERIRNVLDTSWPNPEQYPLDLLPYGMPVDNLEAGVPRKFPEELIKPILLAPQQTAWKWYVDLIGKMARKNQFAFERETLQQASRYHARILVARYELDEANTRKLELIQKRNLQTTWSERTRAYKHMQQHPGNPLAALDLEYIAIVPPDPLLCNPRWPKILRSPLPQQQQTLFDSECRGRAQRAHDGMMRLVVALVSEETPLSARQQVDLHRYLVKSVPVDPRGLRICLSNYLRIEKLPAKKLDAMLGTNVGGFRTWIGNAAASLKRPDPKD